MGQDRSAKLCKSPFASTVCRWLKSSRSYLRTNIPSLARPGAQQTHWESAKRVWESRKLTTATKIVVYRACARGQQELDPTYTRQEHRLNSFHLMCLRRIN